MNLKQFTGVYFSPTGNSRQCVEDVMKHFDGAKEFVDLTAMKKRPDYYFTENEAVVVCAPVYSGRIPAAAAERLKKLHGHETPAILLVSYGNRAYDDALAELQDVMTAQGFRPMAAAGLVSKHCMDTRIAFDRPDASDQKKIAAFAEKIRQMMKEIPSNWQIGALKVPGNRPYVEMKALPFKIKVTGSCSHCGTCIKECPVQAISRTDPKVTDPTSCMLCMRCAEMCPNHVRTFGAMNGFVVSVGLKKLCGGRKEPDFYFAEAK